jgi:hypothetical protein
MLRPSRTRTDELLYEQQMCGIVRYRVVDRLDQGRQSLLRQPEP